jgi:hypothetical protein
VSFVRFRAPLHHSSANAATSTLGDSNDMLAALKAKNGKERKIILNLSYNSKPHCKMGLFFILYCLSNKARMFSACFFIP